MAHHREEAALGSIRFLGFFFRVHDLGFGALALGDVAILPEVGPVVLRDDGDEVARKHAAVAKSQLFVSDQTMRGQNVVYALDELLGLRKQALALLENGPGIGARQSGWWNRDVEHLTKRLVGHDDVSTVIFEENP